MKKKKSFDSIFQSSILLLLFSRWSICRHHGQPPVCISSESAHYFKLTAPCRYFCVFTSICLLSIDQPSRASVCLTSATCSFSSGNCLAALHTLLISMSTCRNICFHMSFVNSNQIPFTPMLVHFHSCLQNGLCSANTGLVRSFILMTNT